MSANPFEVLRLDPRASEEEIVKQAGRLRQRSADEARDAVPCFDSATNAAGIPFVFHHRFVAPRRLVGDLRSRLAIQAADAGAVLERPMWRCPYQDLSRIYRHR